MKKRLFTVILCLLLSAVVIYKLDTIVNVLTKYFKSTPSVAKIEKNKYAKNTNYEHVQITNDFVAYNYQELLNIFYTILDSGYDVFTFYCPAEYTDCISDVESISDPKNLVVLTTVGNYVSPFNNFSSLKVVYDTAGEVTVEVTHLYSEEDILSINNKIDAIWKEIIKPDMSNEDIIKAYHDYIINNTKYDEEYDKELKATGTTTHQAHKANGPLFEGYAICSGYTDVMTILLDRLNIKNFKVASDTHVWNAVYINNEWKHLDLTWDDPVSSDHSKNNLIHKFYLIDTKSLSEFDIDDHTFDKSIYLELK